VDAGLVDGVDGGVGVGVGGEQSSFGSGVEFGGLREETDAI